MNTTAVGQEQKSNSRPFSPLLAVTSLAITPLTEVAWDARKTSKLEKTPYKDAFVKHIEKEGKGYQEFFSSLKKFSPKKVGWTGVLLTTAIEALGTYLVAGWLADLIAGKKNK